MVKEFLLTLACDESYKKSTFSKTDLHIFGETNDVLISEYEDYSIVAIRGSDELSDWWGTNLRVLHDNYDEDAFVHEGFLDVYRKLFECLQLIDLSKNKVIFCGHSMGGAVATIMALEYKMGNLSKDVKIYTAACPNVGDKGFNKLLLKYIGKENIYHRRNWFDIINYVPIAFNYKRVPGINLGFIDLILPHRIGTYLANVPSDSELF